MRTISLLVVYMNMMLHGADCSSPFKNCWDGWEIPQGRIRYCFPLLSPRIIRVWRKRSRVGLLCPGDDDPAHHSASFVRDAVIVVNPFHGQPDLEAVAFVNQITGIPGHNNSWNTQGMVIVGQMVCGRCMQIVPVVHPTDPLARSDQEANGIKCDHGAIWGAAHEDFGNLLTLSAPDEMSPSQAGQPEAAGPHQFPSEA